MQYDQFESEYHEPQRNVLGIVGFALSFCTGPIGLIISLIALKDRPKGFAIAGMIISLVSTVVLAGLGWVFYWGAGIGLKFNEVANDYRAIEAAVASYKTANDGDLPSDISSLGLSADEATDPWGNPYQLVIDQDAAGWSMRCAGMDARFDTADDITLDPDMSEEDMRKDFGEKIGKYYEKKFGG